MSASKAERVLVVEDEPDLARILTFNLESAGFQTASVGTAAAALAETERRPPAVIVLDLMLPDRPGESVCQWLRERGEHDDVGVLMLTAKGTDDDRVRGLELGADDYVVKPCTTREIVLRVQTLARRMQARRGARTGQTGRTLRWRGLEVDPARHRVHIDGVEMKLRPLEFKLLCLMLENLGRVFTREDLLAGAWEDGEGINVRTVDAHVRRLRHALRGYGGMIQTLHGQGYCIPTP